VKLPAWAVTVVRTNYYFNLLRRCSTRLLHVDLPFLGTFAKLQKRDC
jgi:hypothetical protein